MTGPAKKKRDPASHIGFLDEVEGRRAKRTRRDETDDAGLDLDRAWAD